MSRKAAAEMLTISIRKVDYMIADGRMPTRRIDNRVLIPIEEIHKFARTDHRRRKAG
ncbi:MAG TPA: helix-turn-helix domain-containing protein [Acidobacteriaceae bacterium]|nr:helix-turn-helix domain-containing protein [Acidobacteriaceae bacterium]